jgi:hypothetical protein
MKKESSELEEKKRRFFSLLYFESIYAVKMKIQKIYKKITKKLQKSIIKLK